MTLMPLTGVSSRMFGSWLGLRNLNSVNRLIEMGLIQPEGRYMISLHPMIREVTLVEIPPSVRACAALIQSLQEICLRQGEDLPWYRLLFQLVENVIAQTQKDDVERYLRFLEDTFCYMEKYGYESGLTLILSEMDTLLRNPQVGKPEDRALFLDCRASRERNLEKAIALTHQAIDHMPDIGRHNGLLASNLYANLGGRYRTAGKFEPAQRYMEEGLRLLQQYGQGRYHDMLAQVSNYSVLLANIGKTEEAVSVLEELRQLVMEAESDKSLDFAGVLEAESTVYLMLGKRITQLTEELEELRSEKTQLLARFDYAEDADMKQAKSWAKLQEKRIDDLIAKENRCEQELDTALAEFRNLTHKAEEYDPDKLWQERLKFRETMSQESVQQLQSHFGDSFSSRRLRSAEVDVRGYLEKDEHSLRKYMICQKNKKREIMARKYEVER